MRSFYSPSAPAPLDQAHGLRRLFAARQTQVLGLASNPHVAFSTLALDRLSAVLAAQGRRVLVVDAATKSPPPHELAALDLAAAIEGLSPQVGYLAARGLPRLHVDTRGSAAGFTEALQEAAPQADVILLHADATDLARIFKHRAARPILLGAHHPESITHAYAACKLLAQRCGLLSFDLLLVAAPQSRRLEAITRGLADCAERFLGATLVHSALVDPAADPGAPADEHLAPLLAAQQRLEPPPFEMGALPPAARAAAAPNRPEMR
jgi:flagellar biosynthesis protein FlhG